MLETSDSPNNEFRLQVKKARTWHLRKPIVPAGEQVLLPQGVFLGVTLVAALLRDVSFMALVPESFQLILGPPPAPHLTGILLSAYFVSAIAISSHGIIAGTKSYPAWVHLPLLSVFYFLYFSADALKGNLMAVFIAGMVIFGLEQIRAKADLRRRKETDDHGPER